VLLCPSSCVVRPCPSSCAVLPSRQYITAYEAIDAALADARAEP
jgi:hypothetical protein